MKQSEPGASGARRGSFIKYLVSPEQLIRLHLETGYVPIRKSVADSPAVQARWAQEPAYRTSYDQLLSGPTTLATTGPVIGDFAGVRAAVVDGITSMLTGGTSPRAALAATQRKADAVDPRLQRTRGAMTILVPAEPPCSAARAGPAAPSRPGRTDGGSTLVG